MSNHAVPKIPSAKTVSAAYQARIAEGVLSADTAQVAAIDALDALIAGLGQHSFFSLKKKPPPKGLYLWGGVGVGKTMLMDMAYQVIEAQELAVRRFHFHEFMAQIHDKTHDRPLRKTQDPARQVAKLVADGARVLCFDEMEIRDIADAMIIARVMEGFFDGGGVLIATSNRHPDDLYRDGLHRDRFLPFIDLLHGKMTLHELASPYDWRKKNRSTIQHWFVGADKATHDKLEAVWQAMTAGTEARGDTITVAGRVITLPRTSGSYAFAHFDALCATPLAARDYLAIADRYAGLFLHHIPQMDDSMRNEARRFIWLIDALYDRGRFLIGASAVSLADLYSGSDWAAEFPRTLSRLQEMTQNR